MTLRVLHLSTYAGGGGAARAASVVNRSLQSAGIASRLITAHGPKFHAARAADRTLWHVQRSPTKTWRSPARFGSLAAREINASSADIVNLHWINDGFMSIEEIGRITKPLVMSLYDMWPFCGAEHYCSDQPDARWRTGYTRESRPIDEFGIDLDRYTWQRKNMHWSSFHMVPASTWLEDAVRESALMSHWPVTRIPHAVDPQVFTSTDRMAARAQLGIDTLDPIVAFFSSAGIRDERKGFDLLTQAMREVQQHHTGVRLLVVGPKPDPIDLPAGQSVIALGPVKGNQELAAAYSAADVLAVPSREDNLPLTAIEAQMCGRPVVTFNLGGLPDIIDHGITGYLATPFETKEFAIGLIDSLDDSMTRGRMGHSARQRAATTWGLRPVARAYLQLYESLMVR